MMTPATFDIRLMDFEDAVKELERCPEMGRSLLAQKLELQGEIEAEYKRVYDLARELAEAVMDLWDFGVDDPMAEPEDGERLRRAYARAAGLLEDGR